MNRAINIVGYIFFVTLFSLEVSAHAEHDKARYVAPNGTDVGRCDNPKTPCKTIAYAATHANKGDHIRLAEGSYSVAQSEALFYLLSDTIPIKAGFSVSDSFAKQSKQSVTRLTGVPPQYVERLSSKGFQVIVDAKGQDPKARQKLKRQLFDYQYMKKNQSDVNCQNGMSGSNPCSNIDLLSHLALSSFSTSPLEANDIWGHYDLNDGKEYALIGLRNGVAIVDVTDPTNPVEIETIAGQSTIWRDIKVYQYFDRSINRWKSYAYVTADSASVGLMIIDLSDLPNTATLVSTDKTDLSAHNVYLSNVDYSTGVALTDRSPYLHIAGSNNHGGSFNTYGLADPELLTNVYKMSDGKRSNYSHDVASMNITDPRKDSQCINATTYCEIFFDFNEDNFQVWDKTDNADPQRLSTTSYANYGYVHSGWSTEDTMYTIVHDELDEENYGLNTTIRIFDISDLTRPQLVKTWSGPTRAIDHNGFVRGNRYYMSNYERGMTVLDITDPSQPSEVGFFDTYPISDNAAFHGAWGVYPFLPSGNILVSDINSGLYVLRDNTKTSAMGTVAFASSQFNLSEGESLTIDVNRSGGSVGAVSVGWEITTGSADSLDMTIGSGILNWVDGENIAKSITVDASADDEGEPAELYFVRLFNPQNGVTLSSPSLAKVVIAESSGNHTPVVEAGPNQEIETGVTVNLTATASDADGDSLSYRWEQSAGASVTLTNSDQANASFVASAAGSYSFQVTVTDSSGKSASDSVNITIISKVVTNPPQTTSSGGGGSIGYILFILLISIKFSRANNTVKFICRHQL